MKSEMICLLPVYQGVDSENPDSFMRDFEDVCSAFLSTGSPLHIICMVLFPFSLKEKAKIWFHSLTPNLIFTWEDMRNEFLNKFFPPARTNALMRAIQNFSEKPSEPFAVVWERYKDLLHAIPHHGLDVGQICAYFHQGLSLNNKQYIQIMCVEYIKEKQLYRTLVPSGYILLTFCIRIGTFDRLRVSGLVQVFQVSCISVTRVRVQKANMDH